MLHTVVKPRYKTRYRTNTIQQCDFPVECPGHLSQSLINSARTSTPKMFITALETSPSKGCVSPPCANSLLSLTLRKKALRVEIHDASATRTRISSFYLGRRSTRQSLRYRPFFLSIPATELRHRAHPSRQRPRGSTPIGDVRTFHTLHRSSDRAPSLVRRAAACRDARGPAESRTIARRGQRGEPHRT
jgi:hypothetical protein